MVSWFRGRRTPQQEREDQYEALGKFLEKKAERVHWKMESIWPKLAADAKLTNEEQWQLIAEISAYQLAAVGHAAFRFGGQEARREILTRVRPDLIQRVLDAHKITAEGREQASGFMNEALAEAASHYDQFSNPIRGRLLNFEPEPELFQVFKTRVLTLARQDTEADQSVEDFLKIMTQEATGSLTDHKKGQETVQQIAFSIAGI